MSQNLFGRTPYQSGGQGIGYGTCQIPENGLRRGQT